MYTEKSFNLKPADAEKKWWVIDANEKIVGRLATQIATILKGKHKATYTPHTDSGDYVVVVNVDKVRFTGGKLDKKNYYWHTGYVGGLKKRTAREQLDKHPELVLEKAVKGMLGKTSLGRTQLKKLKLFVGSEHTHDAQKPESLELN